MIQRLLSFLFPYQLPSRLGITLATQAVTEKARSAFHA